MRMNLRSVIPAALLVGAASPAFAGGSEGSIGVGGEFTQLGIGGASVNFDQGQFHVGGFLGFADADLSVFEASTLQIGGRFYYHLHSTAMSDFSVGGQLGILRIDNEDPVEDTLDFEIDLGAQIRAFVASNVALSATVGIGLYMGEGDNDGFAITGDTVGSFGIHYYFF